MSRVLNIKNTIGREIKFIYFKKEFNQLFKKKKKVSQNLIN